MSPAWRCETCGQELRGHWCHCGSCCLTFGGVRGFDRHFRSLVHAGCRPPEELEVLTKGTDPIPFFQTTVIDGVTVWQERLTAPVSPTTNAQTRAADPAPLSGGQA